MEKADSDEPIHLQPGIADINGNAPLNFRGRNVDPSWWDKHPL